MNHESRIMNRSGAAVASRKRHEPHPEEIPGAARFDVVLPRELEPAIVADAVHSQAGGNSPHIVAFAHRELILIAGYENPAARVERERSRMEPSRIDVLNQRRLARI